MLEMRRKLDWVDCSVGRSADHLLPRFGSNLSLSLFLYLSLRCQGCPLACATATAPKSHTVQPRRPIIVRASARVSVGRSSVLELVLSQFAMYCVCAKTNLVTKPIYVQFDFTKYTISKQVRTPPCIRANLRTTKLIPGPVGVDRGRGGVGRAIRMLFAARKVASLFAPS